MTTWLCGVEARWTMAAPSCFVTTFRRNMENELPADTEQCPPKALALGLDHDDFLAALAPKPVIILAKEKDYFDARGNEAAYPRLKRLYRLLGAEDNIAYFVGPTYHGYSQENREAMYRWFNRCTGISDAKTEPKLVLEKDETLWCTPRGQVAELKSKTIYAFTQEKSRIAGGQAPRPGRRGAAANGCGRAAAAGADRCSGIPYSEAAARSEVSDAARPSLHGRNRSRSARDRLQAHREPLLSRPPRDTGKAILYVSHKSADEELRDEQLVRDLIKADPGAASMRVTSAASETPSRRRPA